MICTRCGIFPKSVLYRCLGCYGEVDDADMCEDCKAEHIEANVEMPEFEVITE